MLAGNLRKVSFLDLLQLIQFLSLDDLRIQIRQSNRDPSWVHIRDHKVLHAQMGSLKGKKAFFRMLTLEEGTFQVDGALFDGQPTMNESTHCLMEGMVHLDEVVHLQESLKRKGTRFRILYCPEIFCRRFGDDTLEMLSLIEEFHDLDLVLDHCPLTDLKALRIILELLHTRVIGADAPSSAIEGIMSAADILSAFLAVSAVLCVEMAIYAWRRRGMPGASAFAAALLMCALIALLRLLELALPGMTAKVILMKARQEPVSVLLIAWFVMMLQMTGHSAWVNLRLLATLSIVPAVSFILDLAGSPLFRGGFRLVSAGPLPVLYWSRGPWFWYQHALGLIIILSPLVFVFFRRSSLPTGSFRHTLLLAVSILAPVAANSLFDFGVTPIPGLNAAYLLFPVSGSAIGWVVFRYQIFDRISMTRSILEELRDGVVALDERDRIIEMNPAARRMIAEGADPNDVQSFRKVFRPWPWIREHFSHAWEGQVSAVPIPSPETTGCALFSPPSTMGTARRPHSRPPRRHGKPAD